MSESATLIDPLVRGIGAGAMLVLALGVWRSGVSRQVRLVASLATLSAATWLVTESNVLLGALGGPYPWVLLAHPTGALFWLFILVVFEDRPLSVLNLAPAGVLIALGVAERSIGPPADAAIWAVRNAISGLLCLHAAFVIARGWRDDLVEGRRRLRGVLLGLAAVFAVLEVGLALVNRISPLGGVMRLEVGDVYGAVILAVLTTAISVLFMQVRPELLGAPRRSAPAADARAEAADRMALQQLDALMAAEGWRREGLTIGALATEMEIPEHRLRRLINGRLGHRNFADFLNAHRIEAAKRRLSDPAEARSTVAAIAFDLGYGSLGPFNRAFRAATGASPTEWRRQALTASPELQEAV